MDSRQQAKKAESITILIVEDDKAAREITGRMIAMLFPEVTIHSAENGQAGIELYRSLKPELIITDIGMPVQNGIEMAREIKSADPDARFIVLTAYNERIFLEQFRQIGIHAYLLKPLDMDQLVEAIEKCLKEIGKAKEGGGEGRGAEAPCS